MTLTEFSECLQNSTFKSIDEAQRFIEWYKTCQFPIGWEMRKAIADLLVHSWQFVWKPIETAPKEGYIYVRDSDDCPKKASWFLNSKKWFDADTGDYLNFTPTEWCNLP